jgi:hypothetical protein
MVLLSVFNERSTTALFLSSVSTRSKMKVGKCPYKQLEVSTFIAQVQKIGQANVSLLLLGTQSKVRYT